MIVNFKRNNQCVEHFCCCFFHHLFSSSFSHSFLGSLSKCKWCEPNAIASGRLIYLIVKQTHQMRDSFKYPLRMGRLHLDWTNKQTNKRTNKRERNTHIHTVQPIFHMDFSANGFNRRETKNNSKKMKDNQQLDF